MIRVMVERDSNFVIKELILIKQNKEMCNSNCNENSKKMNLA